MLEGVRRAALAIVAAAALAVAPASPLAPAPALAEEASGESRYMDIDMTGFAQRDPNPSNGTTDGAGLLESSASVMREFVNGVLLPMALLFLVVRMLYIAVFPLMVGLDPFDVVDYDSWREGPQAVMRQWVSGSNSPGSGKMMGRRAYQWGDKGDWRLKIPQDQVVRILKQELIGSGKALLVIMSVWAGLNLALWAGGTVVKALQF